MDDVADADPTAFVAVTVARSREPTSAEVAVYVDAAAPAMGAHEPPLFEHLSHWYAKLIGVDPVHVPLLTVSC